MTIFRNCLWTKNKKKKQTQAKEQKQRIMKLVKERTLEDCLSTASSPDYAHEEDCKNGGKYQVLPQYFNRVYPALAGEDRDCYKSRGSLCRERLLKVEEIGRRSEAGVSSSTLISRSRSGKANKRVSFKLPEEADIIIFYSPQRSILIDEY